MDNLTVTPVDRVESDREPAGLRRVRIAAELLDDAVRVPFTDRRVGLDGLLGLLPLGGDALGAVLSLYVVVEGYRLGVPWRVLARMLGNVAVDTLLGTLPLAGDAFDVLWRANRRNVDLIETHRDPVVAESRH